MTLTIVETRAVTGGVDTHADVHVAAALDPIGGLLGVAEFPAAPAGYAHLLGWLGGFGTVCLVGIEGTGSYGAGLARFVTAAGVRVVEVDRSDRQDRRRQGKSDPLDAVNAARAAQSGRALGAPKGRDGSIEAVRTLMVARRSATGERTRTINQARALVLTGPDELRTRLTRHTAAGLIAEIASLRPRPGNTVGYATRIALRELGRRAEFLDGQLERLDELIVPLVTRPRSRAAAQRGRLGTPVRHRPIPASSGKVTRHRLNPGGDRQANHALWRIVITRMSSHSPTRTYVERRTKEGRSKTEIIRCLKVTSPVRSTRTCAPPRTDTQTPGDGLTQYSAAAHAGLRSIRRSSPDLHQPAARDLIRACPPPERPLPVLSATQQPSPGTTTGTSPQKEANEMSCERLTRHRSRRCPCG
jgi:transposase